MHRKAVSFALIGVVNTLIDAGIFVLAYATLGAAQPWRLLARIAEACACAEPFDLQLIAANVLAWAVAVSGSYAMNAFVTFAAESGRRLRWRDYAAFAVAGVLGLVASTIVLIVAAQAVPVWSAKGLAILTSFAVNFSLAHLVVFRPRRDGAS